ncbi:MAG: hypothetical protein AAFZ01_03775 [Pseudomonadota bacterium]
MRTLAATIVASVMTATAAISAPALKDCGAEASVMFLVDEGKKGVRKFANGAIRLYYTDTFGEPVCCSAYLSIIAPDPDEELAGAQCKTLHDDTLGAGFAGIEFERIRASYDASKGLLVRVPVQYFDPSGAGDVPGPKKTIGVRINQATGAMTIE